MRSKREEEWQSRLGTRALNPIQAMELQDAIREHKDIVLLEGRKFKLDYHQTEEGEKVHYAPVEGFTPQGFLDVKRFLEG